MQTQVLGLSVDSVPCLKAWADSLGGITYPLLSDFHPHGRIAQAYGVFRPDGTSERAIFVIDKQGVVRYVDVHDIDKQPDNDELFRVLAELEPQAVEAMAPPAAAPEATGGTEPSPASAAEVVMYCTPWCPACRRAKEYFYERGVAFVEIDISRDRGAAAKVRGWARGYETTPTFEVRGQVIVDFDRSQLDRVLGFK